MEIDGQWELTVWHRELSLMLHDSLGWDGVGGRREV